MARLSDVSILIGQNAGDLEKARELFTAEIRQFVEGVLGGIRRARSDPWTTPRVRVDIHREIETETKTSYLSSHLAIARADLRFKKGTVYKVVADVRFGIEFDDRKNMFAWQIVLVPATKYVRIDDELWGRWRTKQADLPDGAHLDKDNTVRFVSRPVNAELTPEIAYSDIKMVLDFLLEADDALAAAVGIEPAPGED